MTKPEGYPDLIKVTLRGDEFLIDYKEDTVRPIGITKLTPESVFSYLIEEGFVVPEEKTQEGGDPFLN